MTNDIDTQTVQGEIDPEFGSESDRNRRLSAKRDHGLASGGHEGHGMLMLLCCIPMLVIAVVLVASGVVSAGFLITAGGCTAMMFVMMRMMPGHWRDDCHAARRTPLSYPDAVVCDSSERSRRDGPTEELCQGPSSLAKRTGCLDSVRRPHHRDPQRAQGVTGWAQ